MYDGEQHHSRNIKIIYGNFNLQICRTEACKYFHIYYFVSKRFIILTNVSFINFHPSLLKFREL